MGGSFAFESGAGGEDYFVDFAALDTGDESAGAELIGTNAVKRREGAMEDVIDTLIALGALNGVDVRGLFDDADQAVVAGGARTVNAGVDVGDAVADRAEAKAGLEAAYSLGKRRRIVVG